MITSVPILWRLKSQRYQLYGSRCPDCQQVSFPPREVCSLCAQRTEQPFSHTSDSEVAQEALTAAFLVEAHA
jgi:uncharacterized OB-fold protein